MSNVTIRVQPNGPIVVVGEAVVVDEQGTVYEPTPGVNVALCRCGASKSAPFCDGSHKKAFATIQRVED